jgi:hypothetical protein
LTKKGCEEVLEDDRNLGTEGGISAGDGMYFKIRYTVGLGNLYSTLSPTKNGRLAYYTI